MNKWPGTEKEIISPRERHPNTSIRKFADNLLSQQSGREKVLAVSEELKADALEYFSENGDRTGSANE